MKKPLLLLLTLFIYSTYAYSAMTEEEPSLYDKKGFYHEYVMHEYEVAEGYYKIACNGDLATACDNLATLYLNGDKTHKSKPLEALPYYIKSCTLDNGYGCFMSGNLKSERIHTLKDLNETVGYYKRGCDLGYGEACHALDENKSNLVCNNAHIGDCINTGLNLGKAGGYDQALYFHKQACDLNSAMGCYYLGFVQEKIQKRYKKALNAYAKACELGSTYGCVEAGKLSYAISTDITEAKMYYKKACKYGDKDACAKELIAY